ncbi:MAG: tail fiber domain-containing protein [Acidobacteriota bacterium]|jgi:hypothetical protein
MPWVRNGTVSVTNGSASVTGASTTFQGSGVLPGHTFIGPDARLYEVLTVTSNTAMTVAPNYLGSTAAGQAYQIDTGPDALGQTVYQRVLELLNWIGGSIPAASAFLGTPSTQATTGSVFAARGVRAVFESASEFLLRVSRASSSHAAMLVFDDANSGRWRVGMKAASADLYIQRSADGTTFTDAVEVNATTGAATFPGGVTLGTASVATAAIVDGAVTTAKVADGAITSAKIADGTIATADIADGAVTTAKVVDGAITSAKIADGTIATADIANSAVTSAKLAADMTVALAAGTAAAPSLTRTGDENTGAYFPAADTVAISTGGLERMRLTSGGTLLVGRTNNFDFNTADTEGFLIESFAIAVARNGASPMFVKRFGTTGALVDFFYSTVARGSISTNGTSVSYNTTSDYRLKENVVLLTGALGRLAGLKPSRFNFKSDPGLTVDGFIAHEAQAVVPEAVTGVKDGPEMQAMDNSKLVPLLVAAVQELTARVAELEAR